MCLTRSDGEHIVFFHSFHIVVDLKDVVQKLCYFMYISKIAVLPPSTKWGREYNGRRLKERVAHPRFGEMQVAKMI